MNADGIVVTVSEDLKLITLKISKTVIKRLGITELRLIADLFSEKGTYCRKQSVVVQLLDDIGKTFLAVLI